MVPDALDGVTESAAREAMPGLLETIRDQEIIGAAHGFWDDRLAKPVLDVTLSASSPEDARTYAVDAVFRVADFADADDVWIRDGGIEEQCRSESARILTASVSEPDLTPGVPSLTPGVKKHRSPGTHDASHAYLNDIGVEEWGPPTGR